VFDSLAEIIIMILLTPKIGKSRLGLGRPVGSGPIGGLTGCVVAGLARGARRSNRPPGAV
jgi:hypothetical protein